MNNFAWAVLENIFWGSIALFVFASGDGWWKAAALIPLMFINTKMPNS